MAGKETPQPSPAKPPAANRDTHARLKEQLLYLGLTRLAESYRDHLAHVILASSLRLDLDQDQARLQETVARYRPRLLVLDPFVRLHRIDENSALEVSGVLAYLRELQRSLRVAVLVVHHARKASAGSEQAGQSLRGSGDFHAWGDSNLYLRRRRGVLEMTIEHRSAPSPDPIRLALRADERRPPHLAIAGPGDGPPPPEDDLARRIVETIAAAGRPLTQEALRAQLAVRLQRVVGTLRDLEREHRLVRSPGGWSLANGS